MNQTIGRPLGFRIREVLEIAGKLGPCTCTEITAHMAGEIEPRHTWTYCTRAVSLGFMSVDRSQRPVKYQLSDCSQAMLEAVANQDARIKVELPAPMSAAETVALALRTQPNSVFSLAAGGCGAC